jgi:hypothetical protein
VLNIFGVWVLVVYQTLSMNEIESSVYFYVYVKCNKAVWYTESYLIPNGCFFNSYGCFWMKHQLNNELDNSYTMSCDIKTSEVHTAPSFVFPPKSVDCKA